MTNQERINALRCFGYDLEEARFLMLAALHSGYFLRRQFLSFVEGTKGWKDVAFLSKLKANGHCRITAFRHNRMIYHLGSKPLYDSIGEPDNRNRRERQPSTIKNKIMGLDFVLENLGHEYLATEREKLAYFTTTLQIAPSDLPTRWYASRRGREATAKCFVDKHPLYLSTPAGSPTPVVHFCYVDEGLRSTDGFATHLEQYSRLFRRLPDFRVIYIAEHSGLFDSAGRAFRQFAKRWWPDATPMDPTTQQLLDYFEARHAYEQRDFSRFDTARLIRYREQKTAFAGEANETLYRQWLAGGAQAVLAILCPDVESKQIPAERLATFVLNHDYDLFGTLTSGRSEGAAEGHVQTQP